MTKPLISIITPTYNRANFLEGTIESVQSQNYDNIEHLIVDAGSTEKTRELVKEYEITGKVRYFFNKIAARALQETKVSLKLKETLSAFWIRIIAGSRVNSRPL